MKKMMLTLVALLAVTLQANALSKSRSREEARFLTDKMAYELDLTDEQLQDIYEINYDYFRSLGPVTGSYEMYYDRRYTDLSYVLYDWQWREFLLREYFLRPAYIYRGGWAFGVYNYYARTHFFFGVPHVYHTYRGGHYRHPNYYLGRRDMHHHAVAARPRPNLHDRRPQMTRPNANHRPGNAPRPNNKRDMVQSPKSGGQPNVSKNRPMQPNKSNGSTARPNNKKNDNVARPNASTRSNGATRNSNVNRAPSRSNNVTRSATPSRSSNGGASRSANNSRGNNGGRGNR